MILEYGQRRTRRNSSEPSTGTEICASFSESLTIQLLSGMLFFINALIGKVPFPCASQMSMKRGTKEQYQKSNINEKMETVFNSEL